MSRILENLVYRQIARHVKRKLARWRTDPVGEQEQTFARILAQSENTAFARDHALTRNTSLAEFQARIPIRQYEDYQPYLDRIYAGENNVLWRGKPKYLTMSSGTTSGQKYIPLYEDLFQAHIQCALFAGFNYCVESESFAVMHGKVFYLTGLNNFSTKHGMRFGHLGALAASRRPFFLQSKTFPSKKINAITPWDRKIDAVIDASRGQDIRLLSGTPPWQVKFLKRFHERTGEKFGERFKEFRLFVHSGCSFENYREDVKSLIGENSHYRTMEMFPATEAFVGFQDEWQSDRFRTRDMLFNVGSNVFFEFLPVERGVVNREVRRTARDVEAGKEYALVVNTIGGFLGYQIGDNVLITSQTPLRFRFAGRSRFNINTVGEHMDYQTIAGIFEKLKQELPVRDFTLLPIHDPEERAKVRYHWYLEIEGRPDPHAERAAGERLNSLAIEGNAFYRACFMNGILLPAQAHFLKSGALTDYLQNRASVGQNKVVHVLQGESAQKEFLNFIHLQHLKETSEEFHT